MLFLTNLELQTPEVKEGNKVYYYELPGSSKEDVQVSIDGHYLKVKGKAGINKREVEFVNYLPSIPDKEDISCKLENGILAITIARNKDSYFVDIE